MNAVHDMRCLNHRGREAVARCPSCRDYFCRECVTEHHGRVMCAKCLTAVAAQEAGKGKRVSFVPPFMTLVAFLFVWVFFFVFGRMLLQLPDSFHDGTVWSGDRGSASVGEVP